MIPLSDYQHFDASERGPREVRGSFGAQSEIHPKTSYISIHAFIPELAAGLFPNNCLVSVQADRAMDRPGGSFPLSY